MIKVLFSVYFTNHLNKEIKLDEYLVNLEDDILEIDNKKIYSTFTFVTNGIYYDPAIIGDNKERIKVRYKINDNDEVNLYFIIDNIEYLTNNNIKVYAKSKIYKYTKTKLNTIIQADSIKNLIQKLLPDVTLNFDNFTDTPLIFDYTIEDKTIDEVINDLSKITDFDYYFYKGVLYFEDKKTIQKDDIPVAIFRDIEDIEEFNTTTNNDEPKINKLYINEKENDKILATPQIILDIKESPQCTSPDNIIVYTDSKGNKYKLKPINSLYYVYYSPLIGKPKTNMEVEFIENKVVIEEFELNNDNYVVLSGGIKEIIAVEGVSNYEYVKNYNVLTFDFVESGKLKISYYTDCYFGVIEHSKYPKNINMIFEFFNQKIDFIHKIEENGFYAIPNTITISLIKDWGISADEAIFKEVNSSFGVLQANAFGEIEINITRYGKYTFQTENYDNLYLDFYINSKKLYMDEINE